MARLIDMAGRAGAVALAPFGVRSFRFQWPADMLTSWAFEMETLILGWYVLVATESVLMLTVFGSLQFLGTLLSPLFGIASDRLGRRTTLAAMRTAYTLLAAVLMTLGLTGLVTPYAAFAVAFFSGLIRPSDLVLRYALIGDTIPGSHLTGAMGLARATQDSAKIAGALVGTRLFAVMGLGVAYVAVTAFYAAGLLLTLGVSRHTPGDPGDEDKAGETPVAARPAPRPSQWRELRDGIAYVRNAPTVLALMWLAFLVNLTAYPFTMALLPYVAKDIYGTDETGLGYMAAAVAGGALVGSIVATITGARRYSTRVMILNILVWYALLASFALVETLSLGLPILAVMGMVQSLAMISMSTALLREASARFRARVMGVRMLAVYGLPMGLLAMGQGIEAVGFTATVWICALIGAGMTILAAWRWRAAIWV
ncbi:MAG: MFS transporter [Proteobacteria bacterium]|nr:MFS transporter [Pseudomonadota bacterium]